MALGKEGCFGVDLGKVFTDLPPEDFLTTGGGPDESGRVVFTCSDEEDKGCLADPWKPPFEDGVEVVEPVFADWADLGEVLRLEVGALDKRPVPVLEVGPDAVALEDTPKSGAELEVTDPDLES